MSIIEEATKRLGQLAKAGIEPAEQDQTSRTAGTSSRDPIPQQVSRTADALRHGDEPAGVIKPALPQQPYVAKRASGANFRTIDFARLQASGFITPSTPNSQLLHEFRVLKRPLIRNAFGKGAARVKNGNLVMVTSSFPGEGKTFVSLNLALSIAMEVDSTVLLVDADVVAPAIPRILGIEVQKGLMDVLTEPELTVGEVILKTNIERLTLLPAGTTHARASELLASEAMAELVEEVAGRYPDRMVIFDSPPLLATTESRSLASHMGQVVVVVEAERTTQGALENALSTVENCPVVMTMLNKANVSDGGSYYGYYGYGR
jgi:protein-tyrosine kinase